jgi:4-amino-4-deoxy-L-arabinose transferase-like glycosyltransferase
MRWKRAEVRLVAAALDPRRSAYLVLAVICLHVVSWTIILTIARAGEALNSDSTEAYAWGRLWLWGYGKHPPMAGWIARIWFDLLPTADWAMHALVLSVVGVAAFACWLVAIRVVDRRRAAIVVLLLLIYPIFNFRGARYGTDLPLVPMFMLVTLVFLIAFEARTIGWGVLLGLACAAAVLTKYWALLIVGAVGLAAIAHPARAHFFRAWTPYVAMLVFVAAMAPHLIWLVQSNYAPFEYAAHHLTQRSYSPLLQAGAELRHHVALLLPVALAFLWLTCRHRLRVAETSPAVRADRARHIWLIAGVLVVLPPIMAVALGVYFAVDWGTPLYTLLPLAALAVPRIGIGRRTVVRAAAIWLVTLAAGLVVAPIVQAVQVRMYPQRYQTNLSDVAAKVSELWRVRHGSPLRVVAGPKFAAAAVSFYGVDHPVLFTNFDRRLATWIDPGELRRTGFAAICPEALSRFCESALRALGLEAEHTLLTQARNPLDPMKDTVRWSVYLVGPEPSGCPPATAHAAEAPAISRRCP